MGYVPGDPPRGVQRLFGKTEFRVLRHIVDLDRQFYPGIYEELSLRPTQTELIWRSCCTLSTLAVSRKEFTSIYSVPSCKDRITSESVV